MNHNAMKKRLRRIGLTLILTAVYLGVAVPFKVMSVIPGFADIRPVLMLNPVFGIFFGIPLMILMQEELHFSPEPFFGRPNAPG